MGGGTNRSASVGPLVTDGGLAFTGTLTGEFIALDAETGNTLWQFQERIEHSYQLMHKNQLPDNHNAGTDTHRSDALFATSAHLVISCRSIAAS